MAAVTQVEIPTVLQRFEYKYLIPRAMIRPISDFVRTYCYLDKYSEMSPTKFYRINNIYFDTPFYTFLNNRLAKKENRFNMRIRSYGENPVPPYFWEVKCKFGENKQKYRVKVKSEEIRKIFYMQKAAVAPIGRRGAATTTVLSKANANANGQDSDATAMRKSNAVPSSKWPVATDSTCRQSILTTTSRTRRWTGIRLSRT